MLPGPSVASFVGRDRELATVRAAVCAPAARGALIAGLAGVGKTRLAQEVAAYARAAGRQVLAARPSGSGSHLPLAALASLLLRDDQAAAAANPVQRGLRGLRQLAEKSPTVLLVDDAHLLDEVSATVIHQLVAERSVAVLATLRTDEAVPAAVTALWKDLDVLRVDLAVLSAEEADTLITEALGDPVEGQTLRRLRDVTAGNALFLHELLHSAWEAGLLTRSAGIWRLTGRLRTTARLTELLHDRLATADPDERDALETIAVGEPVPLDVLRQLVAGELLETLERRRLITVAERDHPLVRLAHPLYGELLRDEMPQLARLRHIRRLADAQETAGIHQDEDVLRVAMWRLDAGGPVNPELMLAAARQAALIRQYELVERLALRARQAGAGVSAGLTVVGALFQSGRSAEALRWCAELAAQAGDDAERAQIALTHASLLAHGRDAPGLAHAVLDAAAVTDPFWQAQIEVNRLYLRTYELDCTGVEAALSLFDRAESVAVRLGAASAAGGALMLAGRYAEVIPLVQRAIPLAAGHDGPGRLLADSMRPANAWMRANLLDLPAALAEAETSYRESLHPPDRIAQAVSAFTLSRITLMLGRPVAALRWAAEAHVVGRQAQLRAVCRWSAGVRLQAAAQAGAADELAAAAADLAAESGERRTRLFDIEVMRGRAWSAATRGDQVGVRESLGTEVARHGGRGAVGAGALGALDLVRLGEAVLAAELLTRFPPPADWALGQLVVGYAEAAAAGDPARLLTVARQFGRHGMPLYAAEAASLAAGAWHSGAQARAAAQARLFAEAQLTRCERAVTPALRLDGPVTGLTSREREVVLAAAGGASDRAIAARLHIAERTVENHLHRAYAKLGVAGRPELRSALGLEHPPD
ncbi:LuxR family transcriptional regulator [Micromonospora sonchi]|uniref:LuxR family transcriptional regulator n=1 Tax=Micromonospora sonchi TaxID=1763543 RepID=A0A917TU13_9ACTN|nr:LuxR family transcriptional regulator [Micromonospora sonchi]GGM38148.1 LuxR family transcriptional regulator [Micromonospora sonchi]